MSTTASKIGTARKAWLLVAVLASVATSLDAQTVTPRVVGRAADGGGKWEFGSGKDPVMNTRSTWVSLTSEKGLMRVVIRCHEESEGMIDVFASRTDGAFLSRDVRYSFDGLRGTAEEWYQGGEGSYHLVRKPVPFGIINGMVHGRSMIMELREYGSPVGIVDEFDVRGLKSHLSRLRAACETWATPLKK